MYEKTLNFELQRKIFHLLSLAFPLFYIFIPKIHMGIALVIISGITLYLDTSRHYNPKIKELVDKFFQKLQRPEEKSGKFALSGSTYMAFGFLLTCLLFSKGLAITSWVIMIISDCLAAIIGKKFGRPLYNGKSYAGASAFFVSALLISIISYFVISYSTNFITIIISCLLCTLAEFFSKEIGINDNLSIPFLYCLSTFILSMI